MTKKRIRLIWDELCIYISYIFAVESIVLATISTLPISQYWIMGLSIGIVGITIIILLIKFIYEVIKLKNTDKVTLNISGSKVNIYYGDIFSEENKGYKVIPFNEYFDTITKKESHIIEPSSLHGIYLDKFYNTEKSREELHTRIDEYLIDENKSINSTRKNGYITKYELGTIYPNGDYLLLAFTKFDQDNRAHTTYKDLTSCYIRMWNNIDIIRGNDKVYLPLIGGSGLTRFDDGQLSNQDILITLLDTFKISRVKFKEPANVNIVLFKKDGEDLGIDLTLIRERYNGIQK